LQAAFVQRSHYDVKNLILLILSKITDFTHHRFFHSLKTELVHHCHFVTPAEVKQEIFEYIEVFYNRKRRHSANNYRSPADYERGPKVA
jgi:hypothetical protein